MTDDHLIAEQRRVVPGGGCDQVGRGNVGMGRWRVLKVEMGVRVVPGGIGVKIRFGVILK